MKTQTAIILHPLGLALRDWVQPNPSVVRFTVIEARNFNTRFEIPRTEVNKYEVSQEVVRLYVDTFSEREVWFLIRAQKAFKAKRAKEMWEASGKKQENLMKAEGQCNMQ